MKEQTMMLAFRWSKAKRDNSGQWQDGNKLRLTAIHAGVQAATLPITSLYRSFPSISLVHFAFAEHRIQGRRRYSLLLPVVDQTGLYKEL
jgi:hypothetical protein